MSHQVVATRFSIVFPFVVLLLAGCATTPEPPLALVIPVFPPPPAEPRFIYERTIRYNEDVEGPDRAERFRRFATGAPREVLGLVKPYDVAVFEGRVYVTDTVQREVFLFDVPGGRFREIGKEKPGLLVKPIGIDISSTGTLYVCDVSARRIMAYDLEGTFLHSIGDDKTLSRPSDIAVSPDGALVYVVDVGGVDSDQHHIQVFDAASGNLLNTIGKRGSADGEFNLPIQATVAHDGTLYVVDKGNFRVQAFDAAGKFKRTFGTAGRMPGQFFSPKGIATDNDGNVYVVDTAFGNFQIFNDQGELLLYVGDRGQSGAPAKYLLPAGIDVDKDGRVYVVDQFFRKIDVFRPAGLDANAGYHGTR